MKKSVCSILLLLCPLIAFAQASTAPAAAAAPAAPKKATIDTYRVWPKDGHIDAFKAAITAHAQKFHSGNWKWRVYEVLTGPDGGAFMILEGPNSWTDIEGRGDLGPEHQKDYDTNIAPHVEKSSPDSYQTYEASASTVASGAFSTNKVLITRIFVKPGRSSQTLANLKEWKKVWEKTGLNIVVWHSFYSGESSYTIADRLKAGLKDLDDNTMNMRKTADEVLGSGGYDRLQESIALNTERTVTEIIELKPELSSK
jgi:hypothetical protein